MYNDKTGFGYRKQRHKIKAIRVLVMAVLIIAGSISVFSIINKKTNNEKREILTLWEQKNFESAYNLSYLALKEKPMDYFLLTINGFSAFQLGISQINNQNMLVYIDESIRQLRKALLLKKSNNDGRVYYVLGKAYYYKGQGYSDLAIKYLENASSLSYNAADIYEYLGLAYAACGDYRASVEAFTQLLTHEIHASDTLLLSIARSYIALNEYVLATDYLLRCVNISRDSQAITVARFLLAEIFKISGDYDNAENLYLSILNDSGENAEVRYQLGELYNLKGDTTRARSEWRLAYRQDPAHEKALARLYR